MAKRKKKSQGPAQTTQAEAGTLMGKAREFREFFDQSKVELKKITWPTRKETVTTCVAVLALVAVVAAFLGLVDLGASKLVQVILS
jgi:preprotein translocase subunit SecE